MWRDFFNSYGCPCIFGGPATLEEMRGLEKTLGATLPADLRGILQEANGVNIVPPYFEDIDEEEGASLQVIWTTGEIVEQNTYYRASTLWVKTAPVHSRDLLFFASTPNGDQIAYELAYGNVTGPKILAMSHEDGTQQTISPSLNEYLTSLLEACR